MELKLNSDINLTVFKSKLVIISLLVLSLAIGSGVVIYNFLNSPQDKSELEKFSQQLNKLTQIKQATDTKTKKAVPQQPKAKPKTVATSNIQINPFQPAVTKGNHQSAGQSDKSAEIKKDSTSVQTNSSAERTATVNKPKLQVQGVIKREPEKLVILKLETGAVRLVREGKRILGLTIVDINSQRLLVQTKGQQFIYDLGGGELN